MTCECGCGEPAAVGAFRPGHDQRLRTALERRIGGLLSLRSLVEAAESFAANEATPEAFTHRVRAILRAAAE